MHMPICPRPELVAAAAKAADVTSQPEKNVNSRNSNKEKQAKVCRHFINGTCQQGNNCKYRHDDANKSGNGTHVLSSSCPPASIISSSTAPSTSPSTTKVIDGIDSELAEIEKLLSFSY
jgi:hypothetical protein